MISILKNKQFWSITFGAAFVFLFVYWFFTTISPILPFDTDDWTIMNDTAPVLPLMHGWVPARVFQNIFVSMVGDFGALVLRPLFGMDYIQSIGVSCALFLAMFSSLLFVTLHRLLAALTKNKSITLFIAFAVFAMLFGFFKGSRNMLYSANLTCYVAYVMPNLLNAALVCELMRRYVLYGRLSMGRGLRGGAFFVFIYFAMFSLMFSASMTALFVLLYCIWMWCLLPKDKIAGKIKNYALEMRHNSIAIIVLGLYVACALIEVTGKRAGWNNATGDALSNMTGSVRNYLEQVLTNGNLLLLILAAIILLTALVLYIKHRKQDSKTPLVRLGKMSALCVPLLLFVLALSSARAGITYSVRRELFFGMGFLLILCVALAIVYILQRWKGSLTALPLVCILLFSVMFPLRADTAEFNSSCVPYQQSLAISQYIVGEVVAADKAGLSACSVRVPKYGSGDNWPLVCTYTSGQALNVLYRHGMISRPIAVTFIPDESLNDMLRSYK